MSNNADDAKNKKRNTIIPPHKHKKYNYYESMLQSRPSIFFPHLNPSVSNAALPPPPPKIKCRINIEAEVDDLADLINIGKKVGTEFKLEPHIEYNIDLAMIKNLLPEM